MTVEDAEKVREGLHIEPMRTGSRGAGVITTKFVSSSSDLRC